ncbi:MAG TPA: sigma-54 dependent transcriptional regulator [Candidatus Krumholzibacteria bacterium]|nr:sigma-54 dependent transcriptional regulator [Candidatus Krumholzibacteria bacterium]HPD71638.1 sigma-54 dependent transcriptional regulator [Candidatus Krumholzibacteria bacterium]HRY41429.1 sigma-54 dependent transcriptional regulator [Candidatus Krumholzibacteria bacterium]
MNKRILVVDDEATIRRSLVEALGAEGYEVADAETGEEALARCHADEFDLLVSDLKLPGISGLDVLQALRNQNRNLPVILMTAYGDVDTAVAAMRLGAYDYITKPFKLAEIRRQVRGALRATQPLAASEQEDAEPAAAVAAADGRYLRMINACPGLAEIGRILAKVGSSRSGVDTPILVQGESGSGKEIVARAVHEVTGSHDRFMEINCAAVPETLLESELFGHEKGAFTDAKNRKEGLFELAGRGTIFLDEIGEMGILLQTRLLRVLENRRFRRVGGKEDLEIHARIVAATNRKLEDAIEDGLFRNDLYYRLQVVEIHVPPLRERPQDLEILTNHFLRELNQQLGLRCAPVDANLLETLQKYPWPGNVRELRNVLKRIMILEEPARLQPDHFPEFIRLGRSPRGVGRVDGGLTLMPLAETERRQILFTLEQTGHNKSKAARLLGISRQTLREKLRIYEADFDDESSPRSEEAEG